jgi:hypothetical protein
LFIIHFYSIIIHGSKFLFNWCSVDPISDVQQAILDIIASPANAGRALAADEILKQLIPRGIEISQPTLSRRLDELLKRGDISRQGSRRGTRYARDPLTLHFLTPAEQRKAVSYSFDLIEEYRPNIDHWLSDAQRARLRAAGERIRELPPTQGNTVLERLAIDLSWASSRFEGNTYRPCGGGSQHAGNAHDPQP